MKWFIALFIVTAIIDIVYAQNAICVLSPTNVTTLSIRGQVSFQNQSGLNPSFPVNVIVNVRGLPPNAILGFHVHQYGYIGIPDGTGAGGHFNPFGAPHAYPYNIPRHVGDLGNITTDANGVASLSINNELIQFQGAASIVGRSVIIHSQADDGISQPTGNAGSRIAQCVIGITPSASGDPPAVADQATSFATAEMRGLTAGITQYGRIIFEQLTTDVVAYLKFCGFTPNGIYSIQLAKTGDLTSVASPFSVLVSGLTADSNGVIYTTTPGLASTAPLSGTSSIVGLTVAVLDVNLNVMLAGVVGIVGSSPNNTDIICAVEWASVALTPTVNSTVKGALYFKHIYNDTKVYVTGQISGFAPNTTHAYHVHEFGDLSSSNAINMGSHFNPLSTPHGLPYTDPRHIGDLGNLFADSTGSVTINSVFNQSLAQGFTLSSSIIGRGLVIHALADDGSQPVGNAGSRLAQGVIGISNAQSSSLVNQAYSSPNDNINNYYGTCEIKGITDPTIVGRIVFSQKSTTMSVQAVICGLPANTSHGIHVHQYGDITGSTDLIGGHYNPLNSPHAYPDVTNRHYGDLGNITIGANNGTLNATFNLITLNGMNSILGRTVVVHANPDDGVSQPRGNAGAFVATCVIGYAKNATINTLQCFVNGTAPVITDNGLLTKGQIAAIVVCAAIICIVLADRKSVV